MFICVDTASIAKSFVSLTVKKHAIIADAAVIYVSATISEHVFPSTDVHMVPSTNENTELIVLGETQSYAPTIDDMLKYMDDEDSTGDIIGQPHAPAASKSAVLPSSQSLFLELFGFITGRITQHSHSSNFTTKITFHRMPCVAHTTQLEV